MRAVSSEVTMAARTAEKLDLSRGYWLVGHSVLRTAVSTDDRLVQKWAARTATTRVVCWVDSPAGHLAGLLV